MTDLTNADEQLALLAAHRRRLAYRLRQRARLGPYAPPEVALDIEDAQAAIHDLKAQIRAHGVDIADDPADEAVVEVAAPRVLQGRDERNRARMLQKVRDIWIAGVLDRALDDQVPIALGLTYRGSSVHRPWEAVLDQALLDAVPIAGDTSIGEVFDDQSGELLILGAPGAGKTILLLQLTRALLDRADRDPGEPIPVVFNLSSWAAHRRALIDWLADELNRQYDAPHGVARQWLADDQILPLLDGLDEVAEPDRDACVEAINAFRAAHGLVGLAACSRVADYDALTNRLKLQGAVLIQPLTSAQVEATLAQAGAGFAGAQAALAADPTLRELIDSPLMLAVMTTAYQGTARVAVTSVGTLAERRAQLFAAYVERMFARRGAERRYSRARVEHWLCRLARVLHATGQSSFFVERMQPSQWLAPARQRIYAAVVGLLIGLSHALVYGLAAFQIYRFPSQYGLRGGLFLGVMYALVFGTVFGITSGLVVAGRARVARNPHGVWRYVPVSLLVGLLVGVLATLLTILTRGVDPQYVVGRSMTGLVSGLVAGIIAGLLRDPEHIGVVEAVRWSWRSALVGVRQRWLIYPGAGLVFGVAALLPFAIAVDPHTGLIVGGLAALVGALSAFILVGLTAGLTTGVVARRTRPNQGMRRTAAHALGLATLATLLIGVLMGLAAWGLATAIQPRGSIMGFRPGELGPAVAPLYALAIGLGVALVYGGLAVTQHVALRLVLGWIGDIPLQYVRFLDSCAELVFLRKVGGGYIFIHRLLLEYFATRAPAGSQDEHQPAGSPVL